MTVAGVLAVVVLVLLSVITVAALLGSVHQIVQISLVVTMGVGVRVVLVPRERIVNLGFVE